MKPYRQAHRPDTGLRWTLGLLAEIAFLLTLIVAVVLTAGLSS